MDDDREDEDGVIVEGTLNMDEVWNTVPEFNPERMSLVGKLDDKMDDLFREVLALRSMGMELARKIQSNKQELYQLLMKAHERMETQESRGKTTLICRREEELVAAEIDTPHRTMSDILNKLFRPPPK